MKYIIDIECDSLYATKIHCLSSISLEDGSLESLIDYDLISKFISQKDCVFIGHNLVRYDIPTLKRLLKVDVTSIIIDTLPLSWTLYPDNKKHGLEIWGEYYGVLKPKISDWTNLSIDDYKNRCEEDCKINLRLWEDQYKYLTRLYNNNELQVFKYCAYLSFKMDCIREQEEVGIKLDIDQCTKTLEFLKSEKEKKTKELLLAMPKKIIKNEKTYEIAVTDLSGNIFQKGDLFFSSIQKEPKSITKSEIIKYEEPNPNSSDQIKDWLYSLGWIPENIKHQRNKETGEIKLIPQIASVKGQGEICDSIKKLFDKESKLEVLDGLSVLSHRIGILEGFLRDQIDGRLYASCTGLTNTLRLQHKTIVNLPGSDKKYGKEIRSLLIADDGSKLTGADLSGIEDGTKRHYIYKYDPAYVEEMNTPGFDPHLDISMLAGLLTKEQVEAHKNGTENYKNIRQIAKVVNFSATYKIGAEALARNSKIPLKKAKEILEIYWKRNKSILDVESSLSIKVINNQKWLLNPVSGFWYTLRTDKDKFSTLNQGTAVFVYDRWLRYIRNQGQLVCYQCHDEWLGNTKDEELTKKICQNAIDMVNKELKLNVKIGYSITIADNYYKCH